MFAAVDILRKQSPQDFEVLTRVPVTFAAEDLATNEPQLFKNRRPLIEVDYDGQVKKLYSDFILGLIALYNFDKSLAFSQKQKKMLNGDHS